MATATAGGANPQAKISAKAKAKGKKAIEKKTKALETLVVVYVPHNSIKPNPYNPNRQSEHEFELLKRSMTEDGFTQPIIVNNNPDHPEFMNMIVDGEHRWRAGGELGYEDVPVVFVQFTPAQMRIATLRHNRARGTEDVELTAQVLRDLQQLGALNHAQDSLMLDDIEIGHLLEQTPAPEVLAGESFSEAWQPSAEGDLSKQGENLDRGSMTAMTPAAVQQIRQQEAAIQNAKTEEEKAALQRDLSNFRVLAVFSKDEAVIVRAVLGDTPAIKLLEICKEIYAKMQAEKGGEA